MSDNLTSIPATMCTSKVALVAATTTTVSSTGTILYCIKGKAYSRAAFSTSATPTTDYVTGAAFIGITAGQVTVFTLALDSGGNLSVIQGSVNDLSSTDAIVNAPTFGPLPNALCPISYLVAIAGSTLSGTWTFGTSNLSGVSGMTYDFQDLMGMPDRPQTS